MDSFLLAIIGGVLIGISIIFNMLFFGRITGISGITSGALVALKSKTLYSNMWRFLFLLGLVVGAGLTHFLFALPLPNEPDRPIAVAIAAGLLVGIGTQLGNGCTSGHGVCGISRLSTRSLVATIIFTASAMITVFLNKLFL